MTMLFEFNTPAYWRAMRKPAHVTVEHPAPVITSRETYEQGWDQWPGMVESVRKLAGQSGWAERTGFARGYKPGQAKDSFVLVDSIGVWLDGHGFRACVAWTRLPDASNDWKADGAVIYGRMPVLINHTRARKFIKERTL
jgi:hypothetical protein